MPDAFSVKAAFDLLDPSRAADLAKIFPEAKPASKLEDLLANPDVEAVIIATPPDSHLELAKVAVQIGKHVLCEKPLWTKADEGGLAIMTQAVNSRLVFTSCHPRRFEACYGGIRDSVSEFTGLYRTLRTFEFQFFYPRPSQVKTSSLLLDHISHEVDLVNFVLGHGPLELHRVTDAEDRYRVSGSTLFQGNKVQLLFSGSRTLTGREYFHKLKLEFDRASVIVESILVEGVTHITIIVQGQGDVMEWGRQEITDRVPYRNAFRAMMQNFADAIRKKSPNYLTLQDMMVSNAACASLFETGRFSKS